MSAGDQDILDRFVITDKARKRYGDSRLNQIFFSLSPFLIEAAGTFTLVFVIGAASSDPTNAHVPLAIGFSLMAIIFMGGHISGAHYNPAVTIGIFSTGRGKIHPVKALGYIGMQNVGSFFGAFFVYFVTPNNFTFGPTFNQNGDLHYIQAILIEAFITFVLLSVVLNVATTKATSDNSFYGLSIGCVVIAGAYSVGGISGGAFNPAVGTGPHVVAWLVGKGFYTNFWVYWAGPLLGAIIAAGFFRITNPKEYDVHSQSKGIMKEILDRDTVDSYRLVNRADGSVADPNASSTLTM